MFSKAKSENSTHDFSAAWLRFSHLFPWFVLLCSLGVTYHLWKIELNEHFQRLQDDFDFRVRTDTEHIEQRLLAYEYVLRGAKGLFSASSKVNRKNFKAYVDNLKLDENYLGIQGIGFSVIVPATQKNRHIATLRKEFSSSTMPLYSIKPEGERSVYTSVIYLEPFSGRNLRAFGYDMFSEPIRHIAMLQARDSGKTCISGKVTLIQETSKDIQAGFLMYLPVYQSGTPQSTVAERSKNIIGWVYAPFRMDDLMRDILGERANELKHEIYDGNTTTDNALMYDSNKNFAAVNSHIQTTQHINLPGHHWTLRVHSYPTFESRQDTHKADLIAQGGIGISLLLSLLTWLLVNGRSRALTYAYQMNKGLILSEQNLKKESEKNYALLHAASDGIHILDRNGTIIEASDSFCHMLGYQLTEVIGMNVCQWDAQYSALELDELLKQQFSQQDISQFVTRHRRKDGTIIDVEVSGMSLVLAGKPVLFNSSRDITLRKQAEIKLRESYSEIDDIYNHAPCGYHSFDKDGIVRRINATELEWLGYTHEEVIGHIKWEDIITAASKRNFHAKLPLLLKKGFLHGIEFEIIRKDKSTFIGLINMTAIYHSNGNLNMVRSTVFDITDRKRIEYDLVSSETKFRQLFEKAPISISIAEFDHKLFAANEAFCKLFGYTHQETQNLTIIDITHPEYIEPTSYLVHRILAGEIPSYSIEKKYIRKNGEIFWGHTVATEIIGPNPKKRYIMGMIEDITDQVERERLRLAEMSEQKDMLVREVHHRIKNSLQGIVGLLRRDAVVHPEIANIINVSVGKIQSIAIIHGLQSQSMMEMIDLNILIVNIIDASGTFVDYENALPHPILLGQEVSVPIALILNELITNACKHRTEDTVATIRLQICETETQITISNRYDATLLQISKNGQGLKLIQALLPRKTARQLITRTDDTYTVELKLSQPITEQKLGGNYGNNDSTIRR